MKAPRRLLERRNSEAESLATFVPIESRTVTIVPISQVSSCSPGGAIIWVRPERGTTAEELALALKTLRDAGAVRVLGMPLEAEDAPVSAREIQKPTKASASVRAIVEAMIAEVTELQSEVRAILEDAMARAKL